MHEVRAFEGSTKTAAFITAAGAGLWLGIESATAVANRLSLEGYIPDTKMAGDLTVGAMAISSVAIAMAAGYIGYKIAKTTWNGIFAKRYRNQFMAAPYENFFNALMGKDEYGTQITSVDHFLKTQTEALTRSLSSQKHNDES